MLWNYRQPDPATHVYSRVPASKQRKKWKEHHMQDDAVEPEGKLTSVVSAGSHLLTVADGQRKLAAACTY
jgi:hypothetical protein